jgi:hypothetical protein
MTILMKLIERASGADSTVEGAYLRAFDPDARDGRGLVVCTLNKAKAKRFANPIEALTLYRSQSTVRPLRPDGKPNCPLTAFTVELQLDREEPRNG